MKTLLLQVIYYMTVIVTNQQQAELPPVMTEWQVTVVSNSQSQRIYSVTA